MTTQSKVGLITMAYGREKYLDQAVALARSAKRHMPDHPIALVTDRTERYPAFDVQLPMEAYGQAGTVLKRLIYHYSPFEETLFIDSDCLVTRDFSPELEAIRRRDFSPVVSAYLEAGDRDLWLEDVGRALDAVGGARFPKFNGGVYFFRKSDRAGAVFRRSEEMLARQDELGILDFDSAGPGEETLIGLALASLGIDDLYDDDGRLMRTPLNSEGPIHLDILAGECAFRKQGRRVEPAIVHFCGPWIDHPAYRIAVEEVATGRRVSGARRAAVLARHAMGVAGAKVRRKLAG